MRHQLNMQLFANTYPDAFREWVEHLLPNDFSELNANHEIMVTMRDYDRREGWLIYELRRAGVPIGIHAIYMDYGGSVESVQFFIDFTFVNRWICFEEGGEVADLAWTLLNIALDLP